MTEAVTGSLGFKYADGEDSTEAPQDAATLLVASCRLQRVYVQLVTLVTLPKPAILTLTTVVRPMPASDIKIVVSGELTGPLSKSINEVYRMDD